MLFLLYTHVKTAVGQLTNIRAGRLTFQRRIGCLEIPLDGWDTPLKALAELSFQSSKKAQFVNMHSMAKIKGVLYCSTTMPWNKMSSF